MGSKLPMQLDRIAIEELVYRSCLALDEKNFKAYLDLCHQDFRYTIAAHSPEIRKDMTWLDHDKPELQLLFNNCLLYTSPSPRDRTRSRMPSSA